MDQKCAYCERTASASFVCSRCGIPYCNIDCQTNDWGYHKKVCSSKGTLEPFSNAELQFTDFEVIKQIGEGNFTAIKWVEHKKTGKAFALKIIDRIKMTRLHKEGDVLAEKHSLQKLANIPQVVKIFGTFKEPNLLYILQEYIPGKELWSHCQYFGLCSDILARYYMYQILSTIKQMHALEIVHRDIKPENILVTNKGNSIKFVDLGSSRDLSNPDVRPKIEPKLKGRVHEHFVGTAQYMAPECANNKSSGKPCDIWSAGCVFYQLYVGWPPFVGATEYLVFQKSLKGKLIIPEIVPSDVREVIQEMVQLDPTKRPTADELVENPIFDSVRKLKEKPSVSLTELALIKWAEWYVKNAGVLRVRPENYEKVDKELDQILEKSESLAKEEDKETFRARVRLLKKQMKSLLTDTEFDLTSA